MIRPQFDLAALVARATDRVTHDPDWWRRQGVPMPARYVEDSIVIPISIRKETECWECGSPGNIRYGGIHVLCGGCAASIRQQYRQEAAEARREERYDERGDD